MKTFILVVSLGMLAGCSYSRPVTIAPMSLGPKEEPVAMAHGVAATTYFFGFNMGTGNTFEEALEDAKLHAGVYGDTLANVFVDEQLFCFPACFFPIIKSVTTSVTGTLIRYNAPSFKHQVNTLAPRPDAKPKEDLKNENGVM